jgi:surface antigen
MIEKYSMKRVVLAGAFSVLAAGMALTLSSCAPGNNVGGATAVGAGTGALLGAAAFHGQDAWLGVLGGAIIGGIAGHQVGEYMDRQDRMNMRSAVISTPVGQEASWTNTKRDITYTVKPVKNYHRDGRYCREYQTRIIVGGKIRKAFGRACQMPDGQWKIIK